MKAIQYSQFGEPDVLELVEIPEPEPGPDEVQIRVRAAGLNPVDWKLRKGAMPGAFLFRLKLPFVPGAEASGMVEKVGRNVQGFQAGDEVVVFHSALNGGACAERMVVSSRHCHRKPENLSFEEAAACPLAALTAYQMMKGLDLSGRRLLILGASGGVGHFGVQIGKVLGANVTAVASEKNASFLRDLGSDEVLSYDASDYEERLSKYDVYMDAVSARSPSEVASLLNPGAAYLNTLPNPLHFLQCLVRGLTYRGALVQPDPEDMQLLLQWLSEARVRPRIDATYSLEDTAEAHRASETGRTTGKIAIKVS